MEPVHGRCSLRPPFCLMCETPHAKQVVQVVRVMVAVSVGMPFARAALWIFCSGVGIGLPAEPQWMTSVTPPGLPDCS